MEQITDFMITDFFRKNYSTLVNWTIANAKIGVKLYTRAPNMSDRSYKNFKLVRVLADLEDHPEWVEIRSNVVSKSSGSPVDLYLEKDTVGGTSYFRITQDFEPNNPTNTANIDDAEKIGWYIQPSSGDYSQEIVVCAVFYSRDDWSIGEEEFIKPVICASTQGIGNLTVVQNGTVFGQAKTNADNNEHLFKHTPAPYQPVDGLTLTAATASGTIRHLYFNSDPRNAGLAVNDFISVQNVDTVGHAYYNAASVKIVSIDGTGLTYSLESATDSVSGLSVTNAIKKSKSYDFYAGQIYMKPAPPVWENAHAQHVWIEPQRINYIANPSFERGTSPLFEDGTKGWRASNEDVFETIEGGINSIPARTRCLHVTRATPGSRVVLESNFFPRDSKWLSVSFNIKGNGTVRFGIVNFDSSYYGGVYLRSDDKAITSSGFYKFTALVPNTDFSTEGLFRIEVDASEFWVDDVLVDPHESQYDYFDGSSIEGLVGDFRWANKESNAQFSVWYNNFNNTRDRLIGAWDHDDVTEDRPQGVYKPGLIDEWMPTGANVIVHWDAVSSFTPHNWIGNAYYQISEVRGSAVTDIDTLSQLDFNLKSY